MRECVSGVCTTEGLRSLLSLHLSISQQSGQSGTWGPRYRFARVQTRDYIVTVTGHTNDSTLPAQPYQLLKQNLLNLSSRNKSTVSYLLYKQHVIQNKKQIYKSFIDSYNFSLEISSLFSSRNEISLTIEKL